MTKLRILFVAIALAVGVPAVVATDNPIAGKAESAAAVQWSAWCTSGYVVGPWRSAQGSPNAAYAAAAKAVWQQRYGGSFWTVTGFSQAPSGMFVYGYRPGTSLNVSAVCHLL